MSLYENWLAKAYQKDGVTNGKHWDDYLPQEQKVYEEILRDKITKIDGTIAELAKRFNMTEEYMCGFVDGIRDALTEPIVPSEELEPNTALSLNIEFEGLYRKMVEYRAEHLYNLPEWGGVLSDAKRKELYTEQKKSTTVVKGPQPGRNDLCPCGSGKKYKKCCGA